MSNEKKQSKCGNTDDKEVFFDPVDFHRRNIMRLPKNTVAVPSYPGSGAALLGNILIELGLRYLDPYTEEVTPNGEFIPLADRLSYRARLAATYSMDHSEVKLNESGPVYCKTHLYAQEFKEVSLGGIILLVRDPRDSMFSYYNWRLGFSEEGENGSFMEFLNRKSISGTEPVKDWVDFYQSWIDESKENEKFVIIRFEDIKSEPFFAIKKILDVTEITRSNVDIEKSIEKSSFTRMRDHEDKMSETDSKGNLSTRIMRRGKVNEWKEWYNQDYAQLFETKHLSDMAKLFNYEF